MHTKPIRCVGAEVREIAVAHRTGALRQRDALLAAVVVEYAQLDGLGDVGEQGDVRADAVERRAERKR